MATPYVKSKESLTNNMQQDRQSAGSEAADHWYSRQNIRKDGSCLDVKRRKFWKERKKNLEQSAVQFHHGALFLSYVPQLKQVSTVSTN